MLIRHTLALASLTLLLFTACKSKPNKPKAFLSESQGADADSGVDDPINDFPGDDDPISEEENGDTEENTSSEPKNQTGTTPKENEPKVPGNTETSPTVDPDKKLEIKIKGRQLLVDGKAFQMKGVCYNPVAKGATPAQGPIFANPSEANLKALEKDFQLMKAAGINTLRPYSVIENEKVLALLNKYGLFVIVPVLNVHNGKMEDVKKIVNKLKSHRSTLMWQVGNEWNYNLLYGAANFDSAKSIVKAAGAAIKSVDTTIPTATNWGEMVDPKLVNELSDFDIWGMNIYQGKSFGDHFEKYKSLSSKPLFIGEFGADAFNRKINGPDLESQAIATEALIKELQNNLSATNPNLAAIGGAIFEWNDEWWKDAKGRPDVQDRGGIAPGGGPYPDAEFNEEWWGVVDIDRNPRPAYQKLKDLWGK